jgi:hypothetical protein
MDEKAHLEKMIEVMGKKKPTAEDLKAMKQAFDAIPDLWRTVSLASNAASTAIEQTNTTPDARVAMKANYEGQKRALGYAQATPLEQGLIEHAALCWMRLQSVEQGYSGNLAQGCTLALADYWERRLSAAQRRYLRACETLARVRRLRLPAVQVNIADKQVNIAGGSP